MTVSYIHYLQVKGWPSINATPLHTTLPTYGYLWTLIDFANEKGKHFIVIFFVLHFEKKDLPLFTSINHLEL